MHWPATQRCLAPHLSCVHSPTQLPLSQYSLDGQVTVAQASVWQRPATHSWPAAQPVVLQSTQAPCWQTRGGGQVRLAHRSTHLPVASSQRVSGGQVTPAHITGTQKSFTHLKFPEQGTSPGRHLTAHCPSWHPSPEGQVAFTSGMPSQSLS